VNFYSLLVCIKHNGDESPKDFAIGVLLIAYMYWSVRFVTPCFEKTVRAFGKLLYLVHL